MRYFMNTIAVGIDIGGTKTHLRSLADGRVVGDRVVPTASWRTHDWTGDARALVTMINSLVSGGTIAALAVGAHGCDAQHECDAFQAAFEDHAGFPVRVVNDAELIPPAMGVFDGIGIVSGTGSIAVTRNPDGTMLVAGGWGWVIGDEGSASGLVREAGRLASLYLDGGGAADEPLVQLLCQSFAIASPVRIGSCISSSGSGARLGRHAPAVFEAASLGSKLAQRTLDEGAAALATLVERLLNRGAQARNLVAGGGVVMAQPGFARLLLHHINARSEGRVQAQILDKPPVAGACALALRMIQTTPQVYQPRSTK
ncbi:sugar kinase [Sinorhizobium medicae]|uniref:ATPase BadF/BadG/BcrA/BcrD type domain-containing protein n=2 Tax=Sinorhizobium medicae TaxID=110321 RepID=A0ABX4TT27_9HYPH|nr:BadF/BadG/BcrA/BcrD ATPase family protein [Sinorhizobium medicae]MDX0481128.1 sugar kinase [Sinorhizobium medicae]MDX0498617.1 sugar kinase [Sinorhizobium medicae]MDX0839062.1 sugar kinase [Sinorhizobium medicae]MDX0899255.1 sugar kinase [Sinorhizobium medicae]MDX1003209.1 sugar kinase [Sinorhizobium medicae]